MESNNKLNDSSMSNGNPRRNRPQNNSGMKPQMNRDIIQKQRNDEINLLKITAEVDHCECKGELELNLKTNQLTWVLKGEKNNLYIKKYKDKKEDKIIINKDNIKKINPKDYPEKNEAGALVKYFYLIKIEMDKSNDVYNFLFSDKNNDNEMIRNKFYELLSSDYYDYYKTEFQLLSTEYQKRFCLLLNNKYLQLLYRKLYSCCKNIELTWKIIKFRYPEAININLGKNKIQLSRDEELIMLVERKYNITKLINSDSNINKSYKTRNNIKDKNFWDNFLDRQRGNNTYIVGGYKPSKCDNENKDKEEEKPINIIFEDLEKDKYYYDNYETNYLYHNETMKKEQENNILEIKLLNDYSMNKVKENNYFSYSSICVNAYNNKRSIKNKNHRSNSNNSNILYANMEEEKMEYNSRNKNRLKKEQLLDKIGKMKSDYTNKKKDNNSFNTTMKIINKENHEMYELAKFEPSTIPVEKICNQFLNLTFLIKDLMLACSFINFPLDRSKRQEERLSSSSSSINRDLHDQIIRSNTERYKKEIKSIYENFKKKKEREDLKNTDYIINFLYKNAEMQKCRNII